jgi:hypothetical protein
VLFAGDREGLRHRRDCEGARGSVQAWVHLTVLLAGCMLCVVLRRPLLLGLCTLLSPARSLAGCLPPSAPASLAPSFRCFLIPLPSLALASVRVLPSYLSFPHFLTPSLPHSLTPSASSLLQEHLAQLPLDEQTNLDRSRAGSFPLQKRLPKSIERRIEEVTEQASSWHCISCISRIVASSGGYEQFGSRSVLSGKTQRTATDVFAPKFSEIRHWEVTARVLKREPRCVSRPLR